MNFMQKSWNGLVSSGSAGKRGGQIFVSSVLMEQIAWKLFSEKYIFYIKKHMSKVQRIECTRFCTGSVHSGSNLDWFQIL